MCVLFFYLFEASLQIQLDASLEYTSQNLVQILQQMNDRLENINQNMRIEVARNQNTRIIGRNCHIMGPLELQPHLKTVSGTISLSPYLITLTTPCFQIPGYGRNTALPLVNIMNAAGQQAFHVQFPANGNPQAIGSVLNPFNPRLEAYSHLNILSMMVFYNDTFGITPQHTLPERINKFRRFLVEF